MSAIKTLADLERFLEKNNAPFEEREPVRWLKLDDAQTVKLSFAQEIDPDSVNYNEDRGQVLIVVEHSNPDNFRKKGLCTADEEGRCYGCERHRADPKAGWKGKARFYANAVVEDGKEEPYVAVVSQGVSDKGIVPTLAMAAGDNGSITDIKYRLKRNGTGTSTSYTLFPLSKEPALDVAAFTLYDLRKVAVREVPYAEQEAFYTGGTATAEAAPEAPKDSSGIDW